MKATASPEQKEKFILEKGDVIATKDSESPDDIANPALAIENFDNVVCGYHLTHIKPKEICGSYLFRYFQTNYLNSYFEISANGVTRYGLSVDKFNSALILNPPPEEQTAIANYLDRKTVEIDALIAQKERLINLGKLFNHLEQNVCLGIIHALDLIIKIEILDYFAGRGRIAVDMVAQISSDMVRVGNKLGKVKMTAIVKIRPGNFIQGEVFGAVREFFKFREIVQYLLLVRCQHTIQAAQYRHRQNDLAII